MTPIGGATGGPGPTPGADVGNGNQWTVALYGAAVGSPVIPLDQENGTPVTATLAGGAAGSDVVAGTWSTTAYGVVPGTTGNGSATVQVYAWYNDGGTVTSYAAAQGLGYPVGFGPTGTATGLGGPNPVSYTHLDPAPSHPLHPPPRAGQSQSLSTSGSKQAISFYRIENPESTICIKPILWDPRIFAANPQD